MAIAAFVWISHASCVISAVSITNYTPFTSTVFRHHIPKAT